VSLNPTRTRVLLLSDHSLGGPQADALGLRSVQFLTSLSAECDVAVGVHKKAPQSGSGVRFERYASNRSLTRLLDCYDIVICEGIPFQRLSAFAHARARVVLDAYAPSFEVLERFPGLDTRLLQVLDRRAASWMKTITWTADLVLSPNEKEADFLLGMMHASGKLDARLHAADPSVRSLIRVVPFGVRDEPPQRSRHALKGVMDGIHSDDFVLLWNGGSHGWTDPTTLVHAMHLLRDSHPRIKLVLLGLNNISDTPHSAPECYRHARAVQALAAAKDLCVLGRNVFPIFERAPANDVQNFLLDADAGVATYPDSLETRLTLGTRLYDFVWAQLPVITSRSHLLEELVMRNAIGLTARCGDAEDLASNIRRLADDSACYASCKQNLARLRHTLTWAKVTEPLTEYCRNFRKCPRPRRGSKSHYLAGQFAFLYLTFFFKAQACFDKSTHD
jgi:glycosyltransferase involved in cell wall biosynthesis